MCNPTVALQIEDSPKSVQYKSLKAMLELESYLKIDLLFLYRKILANFRCSSHVIMIETGRSLNLDRNVRFCKLSLQRNVYVIEYELHFS